MTIYTDFLAFKMTDERKIKYRFRVFFVSAFLRVTEPSLLREKCDDDGNKNIKTVIEQKRKLYFRNKNVFLHVIIEGYIYSFIFNQFT